MDDNDPLCLFFGEQSEKMKTKLFYIDPLGMQERLDKLETDYYQSFIQSKNYSKVPYLTEIQQKDTMVRLDQLPSFQNSISTLPEEKLQDLLKGSSFDQAFFLFQNAIEPSWQF